MMYKIFQGHQLLNRDGTLAANGGDVIDGDLPAVRELGDAILAVAHVIDEDAEPEPDPEPQPVIYHAYRRGDSK